MIIARRLFLLPLLCWGSPVLAADGTSVPASGRLDFVILRNGSPIGAHSARFERAGERLTVRIHVNIAVKFAFVTVYRRTETKRETWRAGTLVAYAHDGNDDGAVERVRAHSDGARLVVSEPTGKPAVPLGTLASTYWNAATVDRGALLDSTNGSLVPIRVEATSTEELDLGRGPEPVTAYRIGGALARTLLYDRNGVWAGMRLEASDGSRIEYRRRRRGEPPSDRGANGPR